jgi:hypothetical protein
MNDTNVRTPTRCEGPDLSVCADRQPRLASGDCSQWCYTPDCLCFCDDGECNCYDSPPFPDGPPRPTITLYQGRGVCRASVA